MLYFTFPLEIWDFEWNEFHYLQTFISSPEQTEWDEAGRIYWFSQDRNDADSAYNKSYPEIVYRCHKRIPDRFCA